MKKQKIILEGYTIENWKKYFRYSHNIFIRGKVLIPYIDKNEGLGHFTRVNITIEER